MNEETEEQIINLLENWDYMPDCGYIDLPDFSIKENRKRLAQMIITEIQIKCEYEFDYDGEWEMEEHNLYLQKAKDALLRFGLDEYCKDETFFER